MINDDVIINGVRSHKRLIFKRMVNQTKTSQKNGISESFFDQKNLGIFFIHGFLILLFSALASIFAKTGIQNLIFPCTYSAWLLINDRNLKNYILFLSISGYTFYIVTNSLNEFEPIAGLDYELLRQVFKLIGFASTLIFYAIASLKISKQRALLHSKEQNIRSKIFESKKLKTELQSANRRLYSTNKKLHIAANENMRQLDTFLAAINFNIPLSITDSNGIILEVNDPFCDLCLYSRDELIGRSHAILDSQYHSRQFFTDFWNTILLGKKWKGEMKNIARDGSLYWIDLVVIGLQNKEGEIEKFISLQFPITEKMNADEQSQVYIKSLEEMAFMTSHKLRRPVTNISGLVEILDTAILDEVEYANIKNFLKFSSQELEKFTFDLNEFIYKEIKSR